VKELSFYVPIVISFLAFVSYSLVWKKIEPHEKLIGTYIGIGFAFEIIARVWTYYGNNLPGLHLYTLLQFVILAGFYQGLYKILGFNFPNRSYLIVGVVVIVLNSLFVQSIFIFNSNSKVGVELLIMIQAISIYILLLRNQDYEVSSLKPSVTFVTAILLNASVSIIFHLYSNQVMKMDLILANKLWKIRALLNALTQVFFIFACYQIHSRSKYQKALSTIS